MDFSPQIVFKETYIKMTSPKLSEENLPHMYSIYILLLY
jgi:hypothetical protein